MSENKFKVGDRVRAKDAKYELHFDCGNDVGIVTHSDIGVVKGKSYLGDDFIEVAFCDGWVRDDFSEDELELVEPYNPKAAFLSELKELLAKYGASIYDYEQYKLIVDFDNSDSISWYWGDKTPQESMLTADNIMDYEKTEYER